MKEENLNKEQAIKAMQEGKKVTHKFFDSKEFIIMKGDNIITEEGYETPAPAFWSYRTAKGWDCNWSVLSEPIDELTTLRSRVKELEESKFTKEDVGEKLRHWNQGINGWVSVKDALPEKEEYVIVYYEKANPELAIYYKDQNKWVDRGGYKFKDNVVVAWQPLPPPPTK